MNRWLLIGSLAGLMIASTGCLHHNTRGGCSTCPSDVCETGCETGACGGCNSGCCESSGILGRLGSACGIGCNGGCRTGCVAGPLGWQQGGLNYSSHLGPGMLGHKAASHFNAQPFTPGPPTAQTAYPYYSHRGPRDFLAENPPSIGR